MCAVVGDIIFGRFTLGDIVGVSNCAVFAAYDAKRNAGPAGPVVAKFARMGTLASAELRNEWTFLNTHVKDCSGVPIGLLFGEWQDHAVLVSSPLGCTIDRYLTNHANSPSERTALLNSFVPPLVENMLAIHQRRVVHRDIKPSNIVITAVGQVFFIDFGCACLIGEATARYTPIFASDDAICGKSASVHDDVESLLRTLSALEIGTQKRLTMARVIKTSSCARLASKLVERHTRHVRALQPLKLQ
jgi:tRNA A-37 threonylcarbamoyl transferase component Bud32